MLRELPCKSGIANLFSRKRDCVVAMALGDAPSRLEPGEFQSASQTGETRIAMESIREPHPPAIDTAGFDAHAETRVISV
jgi:hypothetical protein